MGTAAELRTTQVTYLSSASLIIAMTFVLAGTVKGVTGMGLPTVVLGAFMPPVTAASLLLVPSFVTNVWQLFSSPSTSIRFRTTTSSNRWPVAWWMVACCG